ncbi:MAG: cystathionine beta-lyase [Inquilinaceae bacterium]
MARKLRPDTLLTHAGNRPEAHDGVVNPPVYHASTILFPTVAALEKAAANRLDAINYGRGGTATARAFEEAASALEGGYRAIAVGSGLAAISLVLTAFLKAGDHVLITDSAYAPTRTYCDRILARFGVRTEYYDPAIGAGIESLIGPDTRMVFLESPGSQTFEVQDVPAIAAACRARGVLTVIDNTWATPLFFRPLDHGVDLVVYAATKYYVGHSDAMMGLVVAADRERFVTVKETANQIGHHAAPDDVYLALRGMRTMAVRLRQHQAGALAVARWLQGRAEVERVLHPALPEDPGHALWKRDFTGASGLFGVLLKPVPKAALDAMLDGLELFGMGYSWGGYESLIIPCHVERIRTATRWRPAGPLLRLHVGLEDPDDLIADLTDGFDRLASAAKAA